jgi:RPA family protein
MSQNSNSGQVSRQEAMRVLAVELAEATIEYEQQGEDGGDEQSRTPNFNLLPTGVGVNRVAMMGTCTDIEQVSDDPVTLRAKLVDQTGETYAYAGKYNQESVEVLENVDTPAHMLIIGKPSSYTPDGEDTTYVTLDPEVVKPVDEETRERWTAEAVARTLERFEGFVEGTNKRVDMAEKMYQCDMSEIRDEAEKLGREVLAEADRATSTSAEA